MKDTCSNHENDNNIRDHADHDSSCAYVVQLKNLTSLSPSPCHRGARARSERPPTGRDKYTKLFGNQFCNTSFRFSRFLGHAVVALTNPTLAYTNPFPWISLGHQRWTISIYTYQSPKWRAHIKKRLSILNPEAKTSPKCPKILRACVSASKPRRGRILFGRQGRTVSTSHIPTIRGCKSAATGRAGRDK